MPLAPALVLNGTYSLGLELAASSCCGMLQRSGSLACYTIGGNGKGFPADPTKDRDWRDTLYPDVFEEIVDLSAFVGGCLDEFPYLVFNEDEQKEVLPAVVTRAAHSSAIPIGKNDLDLFPDLGSPLMDLSMEWSSLAYGEVYESLLPLAGESVSLVKANPGYKYDVDKRPGQYHLTSDMDIGLVDYIVKTKSFSFFLPHGCVPLTDDHDLHGRILEAYSTGPSPVAVLGYDDTIPMFGGDTFEAETNCLSTHKMGQVASVTFNNLGVFETQEIDLTPVAPMDITYDQKKKYVAFIVGDGDNLYFLKSRNKDWVDKRVDYCKMRSCFPLTWTMSPRAVELIPGIVSHYFKLARETGSDFFALPPSGSLYSYPAQMPSDTANLYAIETLEDMKMLSTRSTVHWEWFYSWIAAFLSYFPRFKDLTTDPVGLFLVNVPYMLPVLIYRRFFRDDPLFYVIGDNVVAFAPNEWRGTGGGRQQESVKDKADEINSLPAGSVTAIYMTSDSGLNLDHVYDLVENYLGDDVEVVSSDAAVEMALAKHNKNR